MRMCGTACIPILYSAMLLQVYSGECHRVCQFVLCHYQRRSPALSAFALQMCLPEVVPWYTTLQSSATASVAYFAVFVSAYTVVSRKVPCQNILTEKLLHWRHQAPPSDVHGRYDTWDAGRTEVGPRALRQPQKCRLPRQRRSCLQHCVFPTPF